MGAGARERTQCGAEGISVVSAAFHATSGTVWVVAGRPLGNALAGLRLLLLHGLLAVDARENRHPANVAAHATHFEALFAGGDGLTDVADPILPCRRGLGDDLEGLPRVLNEETAHTGIARIVFHSHLQ